MSGPEVGESGEGGEIARERAERGWRSDLDRATAPGRLTAENPVTEIGRNTAFATFTSVTTSQTSEPSNAETCST